jgi:ABC-type uncharacterized transport system permease subunit
MFSTQSCKSMSTKNDHFINMMHFHTKLLTYGIAIIVPFFALQNTLLDINM